MMKNVRHVLLHLYLLLQSAIAFAQLTAPSFEHYTIQEGLSDNNVLCITQDKLGYMWIGTENGLNRFDGNTFSVSYHNADSNSIPANFIRELKKVDSDNIGILTSKGFQCLNSQTLKSRNYLVPVLPASDVHLNSLADVAQQGDSAWALSTATGFYVMNKNGRLIFRYDHFMPGNSTGNVLGTGYGRDVFALPDGNVLAYYRDNGIALYQPAIGKYTTLDMKLPSAWSGFYGPKEGGMSCGQVDADHFILIRFRDNTITWYNHRLKQEVVSTVPFKMLDNFTYESRIFRLTDSTFAVNSGVVGFYIFHLNRKTGAITFNKERYLKEYKCNYLFADKEQRLWVGTSIGLLCQKKTPPFFAAYYLNNDTAVRYAHFNSIFRYKNLLYIGHFSRKISLTIVDTAGMHIVRNLSFFSKDALWNEVYSIQQYYPDTLYIGTNGGLLWLDTRTYHYGKVKVPPVMAGKNLFVGPVMSNGDAWMVSPLEGIVIRYNIRSRAFTCYTSGTKPALPFDMAKHLAYDAYGNVWFSGHGLARWNNREQRFDTLITAYQGLNRQEDNILTMSADKRGSLWLHSVENGLQEYRIGEKRFINYSLAEGLPSNVLASVSNVEVKGKIWFFTTNARIGNINLQTKRLTTYGQTDGIPDEISRARFIYYDEEANKCYALTSNYLLVFSPDDARVKVPVHPIIIEQIKASGIVCNYPGDTIRLSYDQNDLAIRYTQISYTKTAGYHFFYRLNKDAAWVPLDNQRTIYMNRLSPGKYMFQIRSADRYQDEQIKQLLIVIRPPFWQTWWCRILALLLLTGGIVIVLKWREHILNRVNEEKLNARQKELELALMNQQLAEMEMKALHAQMNPHFIFNCLNSIKGMIVYNRNAEASRYLNHFAHLIRENLDHSRRSFITLQQNISYLHHYLKMEQLRFADFEYEMKVSRQLNTHNIHIAPMLLQPLVENAIWHGLQTLEEKKILQITFSRSGNQLICCIEDNGVGINNAAAAKEETSHLSMGVDNIRKRILLLRQKYKINCLLNFTDKSDKGQGESGTIVTLIWEIT
ncbi:two component regulator with propeller domain [Chitinophaga niastensis]|uniref:Two component regulator with propeller domain n=1 Tax=Chitinophaga niastensis TaxID=536980 RepID=A0A2P8HVC6_CHINA|nr:sensor histidine kinase [Chitinophaga niastensis]PSL50181.1 two component regulator with propeller domain [Chitinophaga niastensis]